MKLYNTPSKKTTAVAMTSASTTDSMVRTAPQQFGTPIVKIGKNDITKPYIDSNYVGDSHYVRFGADNLYPQIIDQIYYQSPLHSSIIDFQVNASIGGGYDIEYPTAKTGSDTIAETVFKRQIKLDKILKGIAYDIKMHRRTHILITRNDSGTPIKAERILPAKVRYNRTKTIFWVSENWLSSDAHTTYPVYKEDGTDKKSIYSYIDIDSSPGQDVYPLDKTISIFNWCYLDGESSNLQKKNIQRSIFGSLVIRRPKEFESIEEFNEFKSTVSNKEGEVVPVLVLAADGKENIPEVEAFPANQNDKAFENLDKRIDDKICQGHTINPVIMGISRPGALGSGSDIKASYPIWEKNVVLPFRSTIEEIITDLADIFGMKGLFSIRVYSIVEDVVVETSPVTMETDINETQQRVIKDYQLGKMTKATASMHLSRYGYSDADIKIMLTTPL